MNSFIARTVARRTFSHLTTAQKRPFQKSAGAGWAAEGKRVAKQAALWLPGISVVLGWPMIAKAVLDGHV
ncbi:hypothetical protein E4U60_006852 [Claviceps pazoutovae]|uniref:Uncharacterized protein n=1 Tax=Claviceps pazoutovae TaxID=1649127 RepID=A0A9P7MKL5_9HYPO|nr:hypothetical protein E4U60_006852 [Claviceps pazoutovae]